MTRGSQANWAWYEQVLDAFCAATGLGIILLMAYRERWHYLGVLTALCLVGYISGRAITRWLLGRLENGRNGSGS